MTEPQPGDFFVTSIVGPVGLAIKFGQWLNGDGFSQYQHTGIYYGGDYVIEAEPGGARLAHLSEYDGRAIAWSTGIVELTEEQRAAVIRAAYATLRTPYSAADYFAIAAHRFHIPAPGLRRYVESSQHMICSQLVDFCYQQAGVKLFHDDRWNGYITPADLGNLITVKRPALVSA